MDSENVCNSTLVMDLMKPIQEFVHIVNPYVRVCSEQLIVIVEVTQFQSQWCRILISHQRMFLCISSTTVKADPASLLVHALIFGTD